MIIQNINRIVENDKQWSDYISLSKWDMAQLAQRINMRQLPPIIFPHTSSPSITSLARYARLTTHFQWYPVMIVIDMIGMTVMSQAPRNSSTTRKSSSLCRRVGFRVRFRIWQGLQMTKMPNHLLHISQYRVYLIFVLYIYYIYIYILSYTVS
jgi:hypothetical protein